MRLIFVEMKLTRKMMGNYPGQFGRRNLLKMLTRLTRCVENLGALCQAQMLMYAGPKLPGITHLAILVFIRMLVR